MGCFSAHYSFSDAIKMKTTYIPELLFTGNEWLKHQAITVEDGVILSLDSCQNSKEIKLSGLLTAGFIDTQVNGGGGELFNHQPTVQTLELMVKAHSQFGSTGLMPTLITSNVDELHLAANAVATAMQQDTAGVLGVHFEGPHLSHDKKGIHSSEHIRQLSSYEMEVYCRDDLGKKMLTVAAENVSSEQIKTLVAHDVIVCLGHSNATFEQTQAAIHAGATGFTHLFNAMSSQTSRKPNVVGAALTNDATWCGIILDGHHVHPASAKTAYRCKPKGKLMLVTDSMSTIGSEQRELNFDGHQITLYGDKLVSQTGQLAGSALDMITAVNNAQLMLDASLCETLNMASLNPAQFLNIEKQRGQLIEGAAADFTLLNTSSTQSRVIASWIAGTQVY